MHDRRLAARAGELKPSAVRELLKHSKLPGVISLGGGIPAPELFDTEGLELAVQKVMSERFNDAFQYGLTEGYPPLRQAVSEICHSRGVACSAAQVYITSGSQQSLDIVARTLLDPGDTIVVERPTYLAALQVFQLAQANILSAGGAAGRPAGDHPRQSCLPGADVRQSRRQNAERGASSPVG